MTMTRQYIDEHDVVARYLADQLSDSECEEFEAYYFDHPEMLRELNQAAQFKAGLSQLQSDGSLQRLLQSKPWWRKTPGLAIAASIVVFVGAAAWISSSLGASPILAASLSDLSNPLAGRMAQISSVNIERTRSVSYDASITLPAEPGAIELRIRPESPVTQARYRLTIRRFSDGQREPVLATIGELAPANDGFVTAFLNSSKTSSGIYEIELGTELGTPQQETPSTFLLEVKHSVD